MNFLDRIHDHLQRFTDPRPPVAEVDAEGVSELPRQAFAELVGRARRGISELKVHPGDRVVLLGGNCMEWVAIDLAILFEGAISVPLYPRQAVHELAAQIVDCAPRAVLVREEGLADALRAACPEVRIARWDTLFEHSPRVAAHVRRAPEDVVTIVYTSGTTGGSKGAMITVANVDYMLPRCDAALAELMDAPAGTDVVYHYLPLCFMGSRIVLWTSLWRDNGILLGTDLTRIVDELAIARPHYLLNVPLVLERIRRGVEASIAQRSILAGWIYRRTLALAAREAPLPTSGLDGWVVRTAQARIFAPLLEKLGGNLRFLISGSAPLSPETQAWFGLVGIPVLQVYGLTETTAIVSMDRSDTAHPGTVGLPLEGLELRIGDQDELLVRGPNLFAGYWDKPAETAVAIRDGWLHTGDQASLDEAGRLVIHGRVKELVVLSTGHNVAPAPLEQELAEALPDAQAVVVGHGRPHLTALFFGPVSEGQARAAVQKVNSDLPEYRRLRGFAVRKEPLTHEEGLLTANGKLRRREIEAAEAARIQGLYP